MKIRILGNRIRLRLSQSEVDQIAQNTTVSESTSFGDNVLRYSLQPKDQAADLTASFEDGEIKIFVKNDTAQNWATSDMVGISTDQNSEPYILVEKDFKCLTVREGEDESDMFTNPNESC